MHDKHLSLYRGKRVLVTGDTGFKGSWLCLWLKELGADVVGYALPPQRDDDHFNLLGLDRVIHHVEADIRDLPSLQKVAGEFQPEFLFHLAAQPLVKFSYEQPKLTFDTNVGGSVNVLETALSTPSLRSVIYVTSDKCYKNKERTKGYQEEDELGGRDPYSASKAAAELVIAAYVESFFKNRKDLDVASVRAGNVIGGGDWSVDRVVPDNIKSLQANEPVRLRSPSATRPWQHVLEPLSGYLLLATHLYRQPKKFTGAWNFGPPGDAIHTVQDLAEKIISLWGKGKIEIDSQEHKKHYEAKLLHLNCDKAQKLLGWKSRWDFNRTIAETVAWYKSVAAGEPALKVSKQQIKAYQESL
jgi:CDP-glucose 4,6-dehydratase